MNDMIFTSRLNAKEYVNTCTVGKKGEDGEFSTVERLPGKIGQHLRSLR